MSGASVADIDGPLALDFFAAGVPAGMIFEGALDDIDRVSSLLQVGGADRVNELCFVGLVSYFEAFCKDHAASVVNIAPSLIENLSQSGYDTRIDAGRVLEFGSGFRCKIGCFLFENHDFGTAKRINAIYGALLKITPFSKNEVKIYDQILRDRNLLVHHGGTFTSKYIEQRGNWHSHKSDVYWNSLVVKPEMLKAALTFIEGIAKKISIASHAAVENLFDETQKLHEPERAMALSLLRWEGRGS